jgi:DNA-binding LytR/AlgR family response regulator
MKVTIEESPSQLETEIVIKCKGIDDNIKKLLTLLEGSEERISGFLDGEAHFIAPKNILYFESVDKKTFIYTNSMVLDTPLRLYELEERLGKYDFFRASKSTIININKIKKLSPRFNGRLEALLENDEKLIISRQYVPIIKSILGL